MKALVRVDDFPTRSKQQRQCVRNVTSVLQANELFVGRMAQLGFAAALIGEAVTGKGPLAQLGLETGIPLNEAEPLLLASIVFTLFAAVNEGTGRFVNDD